MSGTSGRWFGRREYARARGIAPEEVDKHADSAGLLTKKGPAGLEVWVGDPEGLEAPGRAHVGAPEGGERAEDAALEDAESEDGNTPETGREGTSGSAEEPSSGSGNGLTEGEKKDAGGKGGAALEGSGPAGITRLDESRDGCYEGETLVSRFSGAERLAHQAERAISLVERSLNTFMMMHQEVTREKDRYADLSKEGIAERDRLIEKGMARISELEGVIQDKDQEIADLKMLIELMEDRGARVPPGHAAQAFSDPEERANVGDLMEEQLKYIMEDQMVRELIED